MFSLPNLPPDAYQAVQTIRAKYGMTQWQVILLSISALVNTPDALIDPMVAEIKTNFVRAPNPWKAAREKKARLAAEQEEQA